MVRFGSQDLFWYVMEWSGFVWLGNAVKVRCCRYGIGAYCLGTAGNLQRCGLQWNERDACGMFRQSRNGPDIFGGLGNERLGQAVADGFV
jgi:hypothetical protein